MSEAPARRRGWGFWSFIALMLALMALFVVLGTWQVERLGEKERLIANVEARFTQPPVPLPPLAEWGAFDPETFNYRPVTMTGSYLPQQTVLVFTSLGDAKGPLNGPGYWVMTPFALTGGGVVYVNRGFVPQERGTAFLSGGAPEAGEVTITGVARAAEQSGAFTPVADAASRIDWVRDPARLSKISGPLPGEAAPIYVDLPAGPPGAVPQGGETLISFPNNHLGYAITWYGFAVLVPFLLWFWIRRQTRTTTKS